MSCKKMIGSKKCKRSCAGLSSYCWQHKSSPKSPPKSTPKKTSPKSPKKTPPKKDRYMSLKTEEKRSVSFSNSPQVKYIPPRNDETFRGIAWAEEITDLQGICVSSVLEFYHTWDRETFETTKYSPKARKLVDSCLSVMENKKITKEEERDIISFARRQEERRNDYRRERIRSFESF